MTNYIDSLSKKDEKILLEKFGYNPYSNDFRKGHETYYKDGYKVYHTWDHDYSSSKDYDDDFIYVNDYEVKSYFNGAYRLEAFYSFMFAKFHEEWAEKAFKYFQQQAEEKAMAEYIEKSRYLENLIKQTNTKPEELSR